MPVYEFQCRSCDSRYDDLVAIGASVDDQSCPSCASSDVAQLMSTFRAKVASGGTPIQVDGCLPGPASQARSGGCCGGACGAC